MLGWLDGKIPTFAALMDGVVVLGSHSAFSGGRDLGAVDLMFICTKG
jgi:hypothetical protein